MIVDACLLVNSMLLTVVHQYDSLVKCPGLLLLKASDIHSVVGIVFYLKIPFAWLKQVINAFVVDFHV